MDPLLIRSVSSGYMELTIWEIILSHIKSLFFQAEHFKGIPNQSVQVHLGLQIEPLYFVLD